MNNDTNTQMPRIIDPSAFPGVFRIVSIEHRAASLRQTHCMARLFHERTSLTVTWTCRQFDTRLRDGLLASIRWPGQCRQYGERVPISRLVLIERPVTSINLFDTVPPTWVADRELVARARALIDGLPDAFREYFTTILWDGLRFMRYVIGPSSLNGHHNGRCGNLHHSVDVCESALDMARRDPHAFQPVLVLAALLHDAGKADEYSFDARRRRFQISERGALLGHKQTIVEWLAVARSRQRLPLPERYYLALLHCLTAAKAADYLGLRTPMSVEATILSMADRLSGHSDLMGRMAPIDQGFGRYHPHLGGRPFMVKAAAPL